MFAGLSPLMLTLSAGWIWLARTLFLQPFIDETGQVPVPSMAHLPLSAEIFFTLLMLTLIVATLAACWVLFTPNSASGYATQGATAALWLIGLCTLFDLLFQTIFGAQSLTDYLLRVWLDFLPVMLIPITVGYLLSRFAPTPREPDPF